MILGLAIMIVSEGATLARLEPFWSWNTPICWTGFILFADRAVWRARRDSWMRSNGREFALLALVSIPLWVVFEGFNQIIRNWYYTGLPENQALRLFGYGWSFATIWPAIFEGSELIAILRAGPPPRPASPALPARPAPRGPSALPALSIALGAAMLASPFVLPRAVAPYLAAPVWLGFIFLLDPINAWLGEESLLADLRRREYGRAINLLASGLLCGVLWEFWNYWAGTKWHYSVPIMANLKIFEMPLPGYFGFPPFALECFTMYVFVRALARYVASGGRSAASGFSRTSRPKLGRTIGL